MSTFEERVGQLNLTPFKGSQQTSNKNIKNDLYKLFIKQLWKYQNFKNEVVLEKINCMHYQKHTVVNYMSVLRNYMATGVKRLDTMSENFYSVIDDLKNRHEAVLTPSENDKFIPRRAYMRYKNKRNDEVIILNKESVVQEVTSELKPAFQKFGVLCENKIRMFDSKEYCLGFIDCYKTVGDGKEVKLIKMNYEVIDENN